MICSTKVCKNILQEKDDINPKTKEYYKRCLICRNKEKCIHGNKKKLCETCGGNCRCEHNKIRNKCNRCSNSLCVHKKFKYQCTACKNIQASNCIHDKITAECYLCNGKNLCPHFIQKTKCLECTPGNCICIRCKNVFEETIFNGIILKSCNACRDATKKNTIKKINTKTTDTTNCCTNCYVPFEKIINIRTDKYYKTCNACRQQEDERRKANPDKRRNYYKQNSEKEKIKNIERNKCSTYGCDKQSKAKKYCKSCYYKLNPEFKPARIKIKEEELYNFLISSFPDLEIIYNSIVKGDGCCINYRPDFLIHLNKHSILVECDEFQHNYYKNTCKELTRIPLIQDILNRNLLVIRFNPDNYTDKDGKKIKSPFSIDKKIEMNTIKKSDFTNWNSRLEVLKNIIEDNLEQCPEELIKEIYLFYDGF
jgi:hypothetical protein